VFGKSREVVSVSSRTKKNHMRSSGLSMMLPTTADI
jgi:hypothetical protein